MESYKLIDVHTHDYNYKGDVITIKVSYNYQNFKYSDIIGVAPQYYLDYKYDLENYIKDYKGVGEIGLDYYWFKDKEERAKQKQVFIHQLKIAEKYNKIVELHCRDAYDDMLDILSSYNLKKVIFHFYSGSLDHYKKIIDKGWFISIPPKESSARKKAILYNYYHLLCETDSPYIAKAPDNVIESYEIISKYYNWDINKTIEIIQENFYRLMHN